MLHFLKIQAVSSCGNESKLIIVNGNCTTPAIKVAESTEAIIISSEPQPNQSSVTGIVIGITAAILTAIAVFAAIFLLYRRYFYFCNSFIKHFVSASALKCFHASQVDFNFICFTETALKTLTNKEIQ